MNQLALLSDVSGETMRMTSKEVAELTGKEHDNVRRDIINMIEKLSLKIEEKAEASKGGRPSKVYLLEKRESLILVSGYSIEMRAKIIDRWQELESAASKIPAQKTQKEQLKTGFVQTSKEMVALAKIFGFKGNEAYLSADKAVKKLTGVSPLELMDKTHLRAEKKEVSFTPTQIGQMFALNLSGKRINKILAEIGMQKNIAGTWVLTDAGREYGEVLDTGKAHNSGTPVKQIKWLESVVQKINDHLDLLK